MSLVTILRSESNYRLVVASEIFTNLPAPVLVKLIRARERIGSVHVNTLVPSSFPVAFGACIVTFRVRTAYLLPSARALM